MVFQAYTPAYQLSNPKFEQSQIVAHDQESQPLPPATHPVRGRYKSDSSTSHLSRSRTQDQGSLDFTQRLERKLAEYNASTNVFKRWLFEILCWLTSALCMGAIIGIYAWLRNRPMAEVGNLLTYTNTLGKVASATLIVPTSEALGQLKWTWFNQSRAMWDFEIFDKASRGPLGAILLLFRTKGRSLAALGAVIIVLLLAIDSFFQQVVTTPNRWTLQSIPGTLPRVTNYRPPYTPVYFNYGYESTGVDIRLSAIWREFLAGNGTQSVPFGNGTRPDIPLTCPTNNCTWPLYETLAVCSSCADVTEKIGPTYACLNTTTIEWSTAWYGPLDKFPYPNGTVCGYFLNATSSAPILLSGYVLPPNGSVTAGEALIVRAVPLTDFDTRMPYYADGSVNFKNISMPILDALISAVESGAKGVYNKEVPVVRECMLAWCVQTMKSSYTSGTYQEETLSTYVEPALPTDPFPWSHQVYDDGIELFYPKDLVIRPPNPRQHGADVVTANETYQIQNQTQMNAMMFFDDIFPSFYTAANISAQPRLRYKNYPDGSSVREMDFNPWQYSNISRHMERMATAFTNSIRSSESKTMLEGNAYQVEPYISVQWEWLAFPIALLILTLVFLICTIIRTSGDDATGIWKTSTMPTLIYSLPKETQRQFASPSTWGSGKGAPRKTRIKLLPNMGWRISGQSYLNRSPKLPSGESVPHGWI